MVKQLSKEVAPTFDKMAMAEQVLRWSNINSGSFHLQGLTRMSAVLLDAFAPLESIQTLIPVLPIDIIDDYGNPKQIELGNMLSFQKRLHAPFKILLMCHMDTVFEADHLFQNAYLKNDDRLIGPGVSDMKGGICVMLEALKAFEKTPHAENIGWEVLINSDEEIGSVGSAPIFMEKAKQFDLGLLFEPAMDEQGTLAGDRKGSGRFTLIVRGKSAHAGRDFHLGKNAIVAMAELIVKIEHLNGKKEGVTLNVGYISGGKADNIVPDLALAHLDIRIREMEDEAWILEHLQQYLNEAQLKAGYQFELRGGFHRKPKKIEGNQKKLYELVTKIGQDLGQNFSYKFSGGCSDGNNLSEVNLPNVDSLGVLGGKIHSDEEYLLIDSLPKRALLTFEILQRLSHMDRKELQEIQRTKGL